MNGSHLEANYPIPDTLCVYVISSDFQPDQTRRGFYHRQLSKKENIPTRSDSRSSRIRSSYTYVISIRGVHIVSNS